MKTIFTVKNVLLSSILVVFCFPTIAIAAQSYVSFGDIAGNIYGGASIITRVMWAACMIVGVVLFLTAFTQYQTHRRNPKLVPLTTTITYLILGVVAFSIPFLEEVFSFESSMPMQQENSSSSSNTSSPSIPSSGYIDIDKN